MIDESRLRLDRLGIVLAARDAETLGQIGQTCDKLLVKMSVPPTRESDRPPTLGTSLVFR